MDLPHENYPVPCAKKKEPVNNNGLLMLTHLVSIKMGV
jgi:hypothetical protein